MAVLLREHATRGRIHLAGFYWRRLWRIMPAFLVYVAFIAVLASAGQTVRVAGDLQAGQEIAATSVIALKSAWQGKGGSN